MKRVLILMVGGLVGCVADTNPALVLSIETDLRVPEEIDALDIALTASATAEGSFCGTAHRRFDLQSPEDFPVVVRLEPGEVYSVWALVRAMGLLRGQVKVVTEQASALPAADLIALSVHLARSCYEVVCSARTVCHNGECVPMTAPGTFDEMPDHDTPPCEGSL